MFFLCDIKSKVIPGTHQPSLDAGVANLDEKKKVTGIYRNSYLQIHTHTHTCTHTHTLPLHKMKQKSLQKNTLTTSTSKSFTLSRQEHWRGRGGGGFNNFSAYAAILN